MNWETLKYFLAVAQKESLTDAANFLKVSPSTASNKIIELEERLGVKLFNKRTTGYNLTQYGANILPIVQKIEKQIQFIERKSSSLNQEIPEIIRIDLPELLGTFIVMPALAKFRKDSNISIQFLNSVLNAKLSGNASDIVLRLSAPNTGNYKIKRIGSVVQSVYCSADFYQENKQKLDNHNFQDISLISWLDSFGELPSIKWFLNIVGDINVFLQTSSLYAQLTATSAGLGISILPCFAAKQNGLINILNDYPPFKCDLWLMRNVETLDSPGVSAVVEQIEKTIRHNKLLLETV